MGHASLHNTRCTDTNACTKERKRAREDADARDPFFFFLKKYSGHGPMISLGFFNRRTIRDRLFAALFLTNIRPLCNKIKFR